ncbi:unnamed protein product [Oppiella nova]|uniref:Uncharacterized protein n=1 Tax=Oppiella nova TaxID=334625 RepID=A0A7R9R1G8_9ACAR|nr:unnamed protein product [Oppiella nova]CAG2183378.1 unnamed protein product [Oppiella nova]
MNPNLGSNVLSNTSGGQPPQHMHSSSAPSLLSTSISGHTNRHNGQQMDSTSMNPMAGVGGVGQVGVPTMNIAYLCCVGDEPVHENKFAFGWDGSVGEGWKGMGEHLNHNYLT